MGNYNCRECIGRDSNAFTELYLKKPDNENKFSTHRPSTNPDRIYDKNEEKGNFSRYRVNKALYTYDDNETYNKINSSIEKIKDLDNKYEYNEKIDNKNQSIKINNNSQFLNQTTTDQSGRIVIAQSININNVEDSYRYQNPSRAQNNDNFNQENIQQFPIRSPIEIDALQQQQEPANLNQDQFQQQCHQKQQSSTGKFKYQQIETYEPVEFSESKKNSLLDNDEYNAKFQTAEYENEDELLKKFESHKINNDQNINLRANINPNLGVKLFAEDKIEAENKKNELINIMNIREPRDSKRKNDNLMYQNSAKNYYSKTDMPSDNGKKKNNIYSQQLNNFNEPRDSKSKKQQLKFQNNNFYGIPDIKNKINEQTYSQSLNQNAYISSGDVYADQQNYEQTYVSSGNVYDNQNNNFLQTSQNINQNSDTKNNDYYEQQNYYYQENNNDNYNDEDVENSDNKKKDIKNLMENYKNAVTLGPLPNNVNEIEFAYSTQNKNANYVFDENQHPFERAGNSLYESQENNMQGTEDVGENYDDQEN